MPRFTFLRSERLSALLLLAAAAVGLILANSPAAEAVLGLRATELGPAGLHLSLEHWISDGLLALFFLTAAIELKHELRHGELAGVSRAVRPAIAAVLGVAAPALLYLLIAGSSGYARGWPIPTATDIAFALGVLALFGRGIPSRIRAFLLALAVIDDLIAIVLIAVFFTSTLDVPALLLAVGCVAVVAVVSRVRLPRPVVAVVVVAAALAAWFFVHESGIHATIAGVAVGLALPSRTGSAVRRTLEPAINGVVLPLFALSAAMVAIPSVGIGQLAPPFWAIAIALPVGKVVGIGIGGFLGTALDQRRIKPEISPLALLTVGALGGIGFTVSLLMNELAFAGDAAIRAEGTLAVLAGSAFSMVLGGVLVAVLARRYRRGRVPALQD